MSQPCRLGVLAFGDSITNGGGELQWGVALQSWAMWVARGLGLPYTPYAVDGAIVHDVVGEQIPLFERVAARPEARYDLGCLYIGVNDVRRPEWAADRFAVDLAAAVGFLAARCERTLLVTVPRDLGRPPADAGAIEAANAAIAAVARERGTLLLDLTSFGARNLVMADNVHPTAFGQIWIAERALAALAADGMDVRVSPPSLIDYSIGRRERLRGDVRYAYRRAKLAARAAWLSMR